MFSVVNAVLLKPLDYPNPDRIAPVLTKWADDPFAGNISIPDFNDLVSAIELVIPGDGD